MIRYLTIIFILLNCALFSKEAESLLILNMKNERVLPRNFRTTQSPFKMGETHSFPTRKGLDELKVSGSSQFSEKGFEAILDRLGHPSCLFVIDLRQESHGFLNGDAVSWYAPKNWGNVNKSLYDIRSGEKQLLNEALTQNQIDLFVIVKKDVEGRKLPEATSRPLTVDEVTTEEELVNRYGAKYIRMPVTDHLRPPNEVVDHFVAFIRHLPPHCWVHLHCAAGMGRTTTFMAMYDMIKNAKQVSYEDILKRQWLIGGAHLNKPVKNVWKAPHTTARINFLKQFYEYCRLNQDVSWSTFVNTRYKYIGVQ